MSIISQNKIYPYFALCACCVLHVPVSSPRYSMSISSCMFHKIQLYTFKVYQVNSAAHMGSIQENVHYPITI